MIKLSQLYKSYTLPDGKRMEALRDINLEIQAGEIFGVVGESGAGKSTLIRCVNRLEQPDAGQVIVDGQDLMQLNADELRQARRRIGMIFQHFNLLSARTVAENIAFPLELAGTPKADIEKRVDELLALVGLSARKHHYPNQLSGGQKQRVAIARALANHPTVLLSDEATSALDPETKHSILQLLKRINAQLGVTILLITHEMSVIKEVCHRLAVLEKGQIVEQANVLDFFSRPQTTTAKKFAYQIARHHLPESLQARLVAEPNASSMPLWQFSFVGKVAEVPFISHLSREFALNLNILQAQIEQISSETVGVMLVEVSGDAQQVAKGKQFLTEQGIYVEQIGYVRAAD
jgi:D-methionine transport system ATP-binding protein